MWEQKTSFKWKRLYLESCWIEFQNGKYLASNTDDLLITCDEIIDVEAKLFNEETKSVPTNFNEKKVACKTKNFYILLAFLSITIVLLIAVSIYCYLIKYKSKQMHLLPYYVTNNNYMLII